MDIKMQKYEENNILLQLLSEIETKPLYCDNNKRFYSIKKDQICIISHDEQSMHLFTLDTLRKYITKICETIAKKHLCVDKIVANVYQKLKNVNTIDEINEQIIMSTSDMMVDHYDYPCVAMWIIIQKLHSETLSDYKELAKRMYANYDNDDTHSPVVNGQLLEFIQEHGDIINGFFKYERDYNFTLFGYRTLEKVYLKKTSQGVLLERPQHLYMRVAISIHFRSKSDAATILKYIKESYDLMSGFYFTHATPTLYNAGTMKEQLSSCFLMGVNDSIHGMGDLWKNSAIISGDAGGIGIHMTNVRAEGSTINSTQGKAKGLRVITVNNAISRFADQGGKRAGSVAVYIEPWHADIFYFLNLKKNSGAETERARDMFLGLMINDIFMRRVRANKKWSLMCPASCPALLNKYGKEFDKEYVAYEKMGKVKKVVSARKLFFRILDSLIESGMPYIIFKDSVNKKSNQINIGVCNGSNLCAEIVEVSTDDEYAVCNLASIGLPMFVEIGPDGVLFFNHAKLYKVARIVTRNLDNIIDINYYSVEQTHRSNSRHRPIGLGIQGLADTFAMFRVPFDSDFAKDLNKKIFETIYFGAMTESMILAKERGAYSTFQGSPFSRGQFQFNLWGLSDDSLSGMWDWKSLREDVVKHGVRNSMLTTCMPTASTSQIMGNNECFEPYTENIYTRTTLAGDYYIVNKYLVNDLTKLGMWNSDTIDLIKYYQGSIAKIPYIPADIKRLYRTAWEIGQKSLIDMATDRGPFIDQTQSMNLFIAKPNYVRLMSCLFNGWTNGLKTGIYYLRSKASSSANQFGIDMTKINELHQKFGMSLTDKDVEEEIKEEYIEDEVYTEDEAEIGVDIVDEVDDADTDADDAPALVCKYDPKRKLAPGECFSCGG